MDNRDKQQRTTDKKRDVTETEKMDWVFPILERYGAYSSKEFFAKIDMLLETAEKRCKGLSDSIFQLWEQVCEIPKEELALLQKKYPTISDTESKEYLELEYAISKKGSQLKDTVKDILSDTPLDDNNITKMCKISPLEAMLIKLHALELFICDTRNAQGGNKIEYLTAILMTFPKINEIAFEVGLLMGEDWARLKTKTRELKIGDSKRKNRDSEWKERLKYLPENTQKGETFTKYTKRWREKMEKSGAFSSDKEADRDSEKTDLCSVEYLRQRLKYIIQKKPELIPKGKKIPLPNKKGKPTAYFTT